jgi:hypothetical protein
MSDIPPWAFRNWPGGMMRIFPQNLLVTLSMGLISLLFGVIELAWWPNSWGPVNIALRLFPVAMACRTRAALIIYRVTG